GKYLGEWNKYGKTFSLKLDGNAVWLATQPRTLPNLSAGWLMKVDRKTGNLLGYVEVTGVHGMHAMDNGELLVGPGPNASAPQWFKPASRRYPPDIKPPSRRCRRLPTDRSSFGLGKFPEEFGEAHGNGTSGSPTDRSTVHLDNGGKLAERSGAEHFVSTIHLG